MGKLLHVLTILTTFTVLASHSYDLVYGMATGYGLSTACLTSITASQTEWNAFLDAIPDSNGSGNALYQLHDFSLQLTVTATTCSLVQIANLLDESVRSNFLATVIRLAANYAEIVIQYQLYTTGLGVNDFTAAGNALGKIIKYLID